MRILHYLDGHDMSRSHKFHKYLYLFKIRLLYLQHIQLFMNVVFIVTKYDFMKRFFAIWTTLLMCMVFFSSCEKGYDYTEEELPPKQLAIVNGVEYQLSKASFSKKSGDINFEASTDSKNLTIKLMLKSAEWGKEYDLNDESNCGSKSLHILFSDISKDSYAIGTMGPKQLNILKEYSNEIRTVENAKAKICKNNDGTYSVYASANGEGLSFQMDSNDVTRE